MPFFSAPYLAINLNVRERIQIVRRSLQPHTEDTDQTKVIHSGYADEFSYKSGDVDLSLNLVEM